MEQVSASDADTGENAVISYRIQRGGYDDFAIDRDTGVITVARKLDFDRRQSYDIEVLATDGGMGWIHVCVAEPNMDINCAYFLVLIHKWPASDTVATLSVNIITIVSIEF